MIDSTWVLQAETKMCIPRSRYFGVQLAQLLSWELAQKLQRKEHKILSSQVCNFINIWNLETELADDSVGKWTCLQVSQPRSRKDSSKLSSPSHVCTKAQECHHMLTNTQHKTRIKCRNRHSQCESVELFPFQFVFGCVAPCVPVRLRGWHCDCGCLRSMKSYKCLSTFKV